MGNTLTGKGKEADELQVKDRMVKINCESYGYRTFPEKLKAALFLPKPPSRLMLVLEVVSSKEDQVGKPSDSLQERVSMASEVNLGFWKRWLGYEKALKWAIIDGWVANVNGAYFFCKNAFYNPATKA